MNDRLRPDCLNPFIGIARLICRAEPPSWLAEESLQSIIPLTTVSVEIVDLSPGAR
jgi:hypothetical protein